MSIWRLLTSIKIPKKAYRRNNIINAVWNFDGRDEKALVAEMAILNDAAGDCIILRINQTRFHALIHQRDKEIIK